MKLQIKPLAWKETDWRKIIVGEDQKVEPIKCKKCGYYQMKFEFNEKKHVYTLDGKPLNGVTTVLNVIAKPALISWSARMASEYVLENLKDIKDIKEVCELAKNAHARKRDKSADIGTQVHACIERWIKDKVEPELDEKGMVMFNNFKQWAERNQVEFLESEKRMYSEELWLAGTCDFTAIVKGKKMVGDIKTTSGIYDRTPFFQTAAYRLMLEEMGEDGFEGSVIVRIGKDGSFEEKYSYDYETDKKGFLAALELFRALQTYKKPNYQSNKKTIKI